MTLTRKGWRLFLRDVRKRGDIKINFQDFRPHPAADLLTRLGKEGAPAILSCEPWSQATLDERVARGSHNSCDDHLDFLRTELFDFVDKGFWLVLPYRVVQALRQIPGGGLSDIKVAPMGMLPQRDRRPRLLVDLSIYGLNDATVPVAPVESMQFGRALERILYDVRHANPKFGPVYLQKVDIADGYYRIWLNPTAISQLAVALPLFEGEEQLIAFPLVLPMGWVSSCPFFCAATETIADIANNSLHIKPGPHPLEALANTPPPPDGYPCLPAPSPAPRAPVAPPPHPPLRSPAAPTFPAPRAPSALPTPRSSFRRATTNPTPLLSRKRSAPGASLAPPVLLPYSKPVRTYDVYIDDFVSAVQGNGRARLDHLRRLLHAIDAVFRPVDDLDPASRNHVPSVKKLLKGDAYLCTRKILLGWIIDCLRGTLELPPHRIARLLEIFASLKGKDKVTPKAWHKVLGELRSMSIGIPGSRGLFSLLQEGFRHADKYRIRITPAMRHQLDDFEWLANDLASRPTELAEIVPDHPVAVGPHDASGEGMGGVWLPAVTNSNLTPILWRERFPPHITARLVSSSNPTGDITNSDLELAGLVAQQDVLVQTVNCRGRTIAPIGDNTPMVYWHHKGSTTTTGPAASLLRLSSIHQRHFRYLSKAGYLPGLANKMADDCSRLWHLSDSQLLHYFNSVYPQTISWQLVHLRPAMASSLILALQRKRPELASLLNDPPTRTVTGKSGLLSLPITQESTPTSAISAPSSSYLFSKYSLPDFAAEHYQPATSLSSLNAFRITYGPSPRRSNAWGPLT